MQCPACGEGVSAGSRFCAACGHRLPPPEQKPRPAEFDFREFIEERAEHFTGREWLFRTIAGWLDDRQAPNLFMLTGAPGAGKSAVAARLAQFSRGLAPPPPGAERLRPQFLAAEHFCMAGESTTIEPLKFVRSLAQQLCRIEGFALGLVKDTDVHASVAQNFQANYGQVIGILIERIETLVINADNAATAFVHSVLDPLKSLPGEPRELILLVDSLDEALQHRGGETIVRLLARVGRLPPRVRLLLTSRPDQAVLSAFEGVPVRTEPIEAAAEDNNRDVWAYVRGQLSEVEKLRTQIADAHVNSETVIDQVARASEGNFLYVIQLLRALAAGDIALDRLEDLPPGLDGIYRLMLRARTLGEASRREDWRRLYRPLLGTLAVASAALSEEQLRAFSGLEPQDIADFLFAASQFLDPVTSRQDAYRLYHQSLADFLGDRNRAGVEFWIDFASAHKRVAEHYWTICRILLETPDDRRSAAWAEAPLDGYGFRYLIEHLTAAGMQEEANRLLLHYDWIAAKLHATDVTSLLGDYQDSTDGEVHLVGRTLMLSADVIGRHPAQLPSQIVGRLRSVESAGVETLIERAEAERASLWFRPRTRSLMRPGPLVRRFDGHQDAVISVALLADGRRALSGSRDRTLRLWDLETGVENRRFEGHAGWVFSVAPLADGRHALSGSDDRTLRLWDLETDEELRRFDGHEYGVLSVTPLADGRRALSGSQDRTLRMWDLESGAELRRFKGHDGGVTSVAVLADGRRALSGSVDGTLRLWDLETGVELRHFEGHESWVLSVAPLADGRRALSGSVDRTLRLWDLETGAELRRFDGHKDWVTSVAVLVGGRVALSGSWDCTLRLWDLEGGAELHRFHGHEDLVFSVALPVHGGRAVSGSADRTLRLWDLEIGGELRRCEGHEDWVRSVAVLADGWRALSGADDRTLRLWDLESGAELRRFKGHEGGVRSVAPLVDGRRALSGSDDGTLLLWDLESGAELCRFKGHEFEITSVAPLVDGRRALSGSWDRTLLLWDLESGAELRRFKGHEGGVRSVAPLTDGHRVLSGSADGTMRLWDLESGAGICRFEGHEDGVTSVALLADGRRAISGSDDRTLRLWDLESGAELCRFDGHQASVSSVAPLPNGRRALSGSYDRTLRLWDLDTGACLAVFTGDAAITAVAVVRDNLFVAGSANGAIHILELRDTGPMGPTHAL